MEKPNVAGSQPVKVQLNTGESYSWCACGLSENQPFCDGSHKTTDFKPVRFMVENTGEYYLCMCKQSGNKPYCDGTHKTL